MILLRPQKAKASFYVKTDAEGRKRRSRKGLDTLVVYAVNDECDKLELIFWLSNESVITPPGEYGCKAETQNNRRSSETSSEACYLIRWPA